MSCRWSSVVGLKRSEQGLPLATSSRTQIVLLYFSSFYLIGIPRYIENPVKEDGLKILYNEI
jgi:hypothetical protein